jgi:hypothetical protein
MAAILIEEALTARKLLKGQKNPLLPRKARGIRGSNE